MSEQLPTHIDHNTHPYLIKIVYAYRPHTCPPSRQQLLERKYDITGHCSLKSITQQCGYDYTHEIKSRK